MSESITNRKNAAERTAAGAAVFGTGAGLNWINNNRFPASEKPTIIRAIKDKSFSARHARYLGAKAASRSIQGAGVTVGILGAGQLVRGDKNKKFSVKDEVVRPLVYADEIEGKVKSHVTKGAEEDKELLRIKDRTRHYLQVGGAIGGGALLLRAPEFAGALKNVPKSKVLVRAKKIEPTATKISNNLLAVGSGIGAAGAFNSAKMQKLENQKFKEISKASKDSKERSDKQKLGLAAAAGAGAGLAFPTLQKLPDDQGASARISDQLKGTTEGRVKVADVRGVARGPGKRFGAERNQAKLTQAIRTKGYDPSRPIEVGRFADGRMMVTGGHHRLRAVEDLGYKDVPVRVRNEAGKTPRSVVPLYDSAKYVKDVIRNRQAKKPLDEAGLKRVESLAAQKMPKGIERANKVKSTTEESIQRLKTPRNKAILAATGAAGATAYGANKLNDNKVAKRDDKFLNQYRDRISPSAEEGYRYLKRGANSRKIDATANAALGTGLLVHAGHIATKKRPMAVLEALGGGIALKTAASSQADARVWNAKLDRIKDAAKQREAAGTWGRDRKVDVAKSIWVEKGLRVGLAYPKGMRRSGIRPGHLRRTASGKIISVRGSVG